MSAAPSHICAPSAPLHKVVRASCTEECAIGLKFESKGFCVGVLARNLLTSFSGPAVSQTHSRINQASPTGPPWGQSAGEDYLKRGGKSAGEQTRSGSHVVIMSVMLTTSRWPCKWRLATQLSASHVQRFMLQARISQHSSNLPAPPCAGLKLTAGC